MYSFFPIFDWKQLEPKIFKQFNFLLKINLQFGIFYLLEKENINFVDLKDEERGLLTVEEEEEVKQIQEDHRELLTIPRRWNVCLWKAFHALKKYVFPI